MGQPADGRSGHSGDQRIQHVFKTWRFNWCVVSRCRNGQYLVVSQSQLGEARSLWGCQTVPIRDDQDVICLMSLFVHTMAAAVNSLYELDSDGSCDGTRPGILAWTCKAFDFWLCNPTVRGRGGSWPATPSGMPWEWTWIWASEEACSEGRLLSSPYSNALSHYLRRSTDQWGGRVDIVVKSRSSYRAAGSDRGRHHWSWVR